MKEMLEGRCIEVEDAGRASRLDKFEGYELVHDIDTVILKIVMMNIINFNVIIK
jgi:hypothetical protein